MATLKGRTDANTYSISQLLFIKDKIVARFNMFDFINCSDDTLSILFQVRPGEEFSPVPMDKRHTAKDIRDFNKLGQKQRLSIITSPQISTPAAKNLWPCYGIDLGMTIVILFFVYYIISNFRYILFFL